MVMVMRFSGLSAFSAFSGLSGLSVPADEPLRLRRVTVFAAGEAGKADEAGEADETGEADEA
jgi:hypothetical protein